MARSAASFFGVSFWMVWYALPISPSASLMTSTSAGSFSKSTAAEPAKGSTYTRCFGSSFTSRGASRFLPAGEPQIVFSTGAGASVPSSSRARLRAAWTRSAMAQPLGIAAPRRLVRVARGHVARPAVLGLVRDPLLGRGRRRRRGLDRGADRGGELRQGARRVGGHGRVAGRGELVHQHG